LLVIGYDEKGAHLYECSPSGNYFDYLAVSIGARSQSAKTYLEKYYLEFMNSDLDGLIVHGIRSIRDTLQQDKTITTANVTVGFVGKDYKFTILEGESLQKYIDLLDTVMDTST
jgi:20S proteasome subunit alpha 6